MSNENRSLEVVIAIDSSYDSLGYYMRLPKFIPHSIEIASIPVTHFSFDDSFDYGSTNNYCGGYNISGDCPIASKIFDHTLNANQKACVEYWGDIIHITGKLFGYEVYYDYQSQVLASYHHKYV